MEFRNLGRSGLRVSVVGLGCNNFGGRSDLEDARKVVHKALDVGINFFDTADSYARGNRGGSEKILGEIFKSNRRDVVIATKFALPMDDEGKKKGASRRYIMNAVEDSLKRLNTDYIDLYQQHRMDPLTPIEETLRALDDLVRQGKVRYIGCSNFSAWRMVEAQWTARQNGLNAFVSCQDEYSLIVRYIEKELMPAMQEYGLGLLPYFPLASGLLTGKYKRGQAASEGRLAGPGELTDRYINDAAFDFTEALEAFAKERGHTLLELAFSWLASTAPVTSVIAGATRPEQIEQNAKAASWKLSAEELAGVEAIRQRMKVLDPH
ncbi:MAG TPA: aldo/keto reductase [Xanthobacteraceae bacterium]|nr:aldo/keto reductase [Xanthobacteraceae bacterium]